jgi:hypothetical protein
VGHLLACLKTRLPSTSVSASGEPCAPGRGKRHSHNLLQQCSIFTIVIRGMRFGIRGMSSEEASVVWAEGRFEEGADEGDDQRT